MTVTTDWHGDSDVAQAPSQRHGNGYSGLRPGRPGLISQRLGEPPTVGMRRWVQLVRFARLSLLALIRVGPASDSLETLAYRPERLPTASFT